MTNLLRRGMPLLAATAFLVPAFPALAGPEFVRNGTAGFVVSHIHYALGPDAEKTGACPNGLNVGGRELFKRMPDGAQRKDETDQEYQARAADGVRKFTTGEDGLSICMNPKAGAIDPNFRTVVPSNIAAEGFDLDGAGASSGRGARATCPHEDFAGVDGKGGVDNQFYRAVGCSYGYQSVGTANGFETEMLTGSWGILVRVEGVDDIRNDDDVKVTISANADPIQLSADRNALPYATYAMDRDPRFRGTAIGRIKDGVLTSDPMDVRFHNVRNSMFVERALQHARLRATIADDGTLTGYLGGYADVEELWENMYAYTKAKNAAGEPLPAKRVSGTVSGASGSHHITCPALYDAFHRMADADPDPKTGRCKSISMQYRLSAVPAFVVDVPPEKSINAANPTESTNAALETPRNVRPQ